MILRLTATEDVSVLPPIGEVLDAEGLRGALRLLDDPGARVARLDLGALRLPTAEGLGLLVSINKELRARGGGLVLCNVPADAYEVFEGLHLVDVLDVRQRGASRRPRTSVEPKGVS